jgi:pseudaminic acid synthase
MTGAEAFRIGARQIGPGHPCFVVAELSANHQHDRHRAKQLVQAAARAGADAIKLQTYTADTITIDSDAEWFRVPDGSLWSGRTLYDLYSEAHTPWEWHAELFEAARQAGLEWFSTPFDLTAVLFLEELGVPAHKVASFELVDSPLLDAIGRTRKPVIMSTGMATVDEIAEAVATLRSAGTTHLVLLKCTSAYPAPPESMNLRTIEDLRRRFDVIAGLSDHTLGSAVAVAAVAVGAAVVEKHFTLSRADGGPDAAFSMEPDEFAAMVRDIRVAEGALGGVSYERTAAERISVTHRKSLFVVEDVAAGETFTQKNVRVIRPGFGLPPRHLGDVLGRRASKNVARGTPLEWHLVV